MNMHIKRVDCLYNTINRSIANRLRFLVFLNNDINSHILLEQLKKLSLEQLKVNN